MDGSPRGVGALVAFGVLLCALFVGLFSSGSFQTAPLTGLVTHGTYAAFSAPEPGFTVGGGLVRASDTAVYKTAWYSVNGSAWQSLTLSGSAYGSSTTWLSGAVSAALPAALSGAGEHYLIVYTCTASSGSWDCHGAAPGTGGWQLLVINNAVSSCGGSVCGVGEYCSAQNVCLLSVPGNTYFVAVNGSDSNPGTYERPFATWQKAVLVSRPGDITYIRGGTWQPTTHIADDLTPIGMLIDPIGYHQGVSGTKEAPIRYYNYPGEKPVLDGSLVGPNANRWIGGIYIGTAQYIYLKGLTISHLHETPPDHNPATNHEKNYSEAYGISSEGANIRYENMVVHDIDGRGFQHWSGAWTEADAWVDGVYHPSPFASDNTTWINCDAYNLFDRYSDIPGNNADGWKVQGYVGNHFSWEGCRAWNYSDDGFDPSGPEYRTFKNCWAMSTDKYKGLNPAWPMEGNGFKMTGGGTASVRMENCIAANCVGVGFYNNINVRFGTGGPNEGTFYNNLAYRNAVGFGDGGNASTYRNNIVYDSQKLGPTNEKLELETSDAWYTESNNTWIENDPTPGSWPWFYYNPAFTVTDADFVSLDYWQLTQPRKADGSLPDITFGHLKAGSDLIDKGAAVGLPYSGTAPDLGPFEYRG